MESELQRERRIQHYHKKIAAYVGLVAGSLVSQFIHGWASVYSCIVFALILGTYAAWWIRLLKKTPR
jgi:hypothetical protein